MTILSNFTVVHVPGAPQNIKASNITLSSISLSWSPPPIADRHGLAISSYIINCSTNTYFIQENVIVSTDNQNATLSNLHPLTSYHCCVAGNSSRGIGKSACQRTFTLDESESACNTINFYTLPFIQWHACVHVQSTYIVCINFVLLFQQIDTHLIIHRQDLLSKAQSLTLQPHSSTGVHLLYRIMCV